MRDGLSNEGFLYYIGVDIILIDRDGRREETASLPTLTQKIVST